MPFSGSMAGGGKGGGGGGADGERVRTHMMFSESKVDQKTNRKRKRGRQNKLHARVHQNDAMIQTNDGEEVDPTEWTGNQRVVHFGPMGQRDPFFYYYPKGWDILYPAHFGFFPYRTKKFRGSSPTVCLAAFGTFFILAGALMTWLAYFYLYSSTPWALFMGPRRGGTSSTDRTDLIHVFLDIPPIQVAGPVFLLIGSVFLLIGGCWWFLSLRLFSERLRHSQPHHKPPRRTVHQRPLPQVILKENVQDKSPYIPPPPPAVTVLTNEHTQQFMYTPESEMKLYPPVMPGYSSLSLAHSSVYVGSPYNTLGSRTGTLPAGGRSMTAGGLEGIMENWPEYHAANLQHKTFIDN